MSSSDHGAAQEGPPNSPLIDEASTVSQSLTVCTEDQGLPNNAVTAGSCDISQFGGNGPHAAVSVLDDNEEGSRPSDNVQTGHIAVMDDIEVGEPTPNYTSIVNQNERVGIEQIDDNASPSDTTSATLAASLESTNKVTMRNVELANDESMPPPFDSSEFDDSARKRKMSKNMSDGLAVYEESRMAVNNLDVGGDEESPPIHPNPTADVGTNVDSNHEPEPEPEPRPSAGNGGDNRTAPQAPTSGRPSASSQDDLPRLEAYLVEERSEAGVVDAYAEPLLPWWKQKRAKLMLSFFSLVLVAFAIALGVTLSSSRGNSVSSNVSETFMIAISDAPSSSNVPTIYPTAISSTSPSVQTSALPSSSLVPTSSPTFCADSVVSNRQTIDLQIDNPMKPKVAVDGNNMVVVVGEGDTSVLHIMFYSLVDNIWVKKAKFQEDCESYEVAISGMTAFVKCKDLVFVYEQNEFGFWAQMEDPFVQIDGIHHDGFEGNG